MTRPGFRLRRASPGRHQPRLLHCAGSCCVPSMAPPPNPGPSTIAVAARRVAAIGIWRLLAVAMPHLAALVIMLRTETDFGSRIGFLLAWGVLHFFFLLLLRPPGVFAA